MANLYVTPTGSGKKDGSSWDNAAAFSSLNSVAKKAGDGGTVFLAADQGTYKPTGSVNIAQAGVTIKGVNKDGSAGMATFEGTRAHDWKPGATDGLELFRVAAGADRVSFSNITANNVGTVFRVTGDVQKLGINNVDANNVAVFLNDYASGKTATITGLTVTDVEVKGFSKGVIKLRYDTSDVLIQDVRGDSQFQDGDNFAVGVHLDDRVHDVVLRRVAMENATATGTAKDYWQGDGFSAEGGTYNITFEDTVARGNTDGGYDIKSDHVTMIRAIAEGNGRNYRFWGNDVTVKDSVGKDPHKLGGISTQSQIWIGKGATVTVENSSFTDSGKNTKAIYNEGGTLDFVDSTLSVADTAIVFFGKQSPGTKALEVIKVAATGGYSVATPDAAAAPAPSAPAVTTPVVTTPVVVTPVATTPVVAAETTAPVVATRAPAPAEPIKVAPPVTVPTTLVVGDAIKAVAAVNALKSTAASETLKGTAEHDAFFFDIVAGKTGTDTISGFGADDVLVLRKALADGNGDGLITFGSNGMLDLGDKASKVKIADIAKTGLRLLGETADGFVYGEAAVRPVKAKEGKLGVADTLTGDAKDKAADVFFFDTALDRALGADKVMKFGAKDVIVTTEALGGAATTGAKLSAVNGAFALDHDGLNLGSFSVADLNGAAVTALEFDGMKIVDDVQYFVYSAVGSTAGVAALG